MHLPGAMFESVEQRIMYSMALSENNEIDQIDPDRFRYKLTATIAP